MNHTAYTDLKISPDFSTFQFASPGPDGPIIRQVRFHGQPGGQLYVLDLKTGKKEDPEQFDGNDMRQVAATVVRIIRIYSTKYPRRVIWLRPDNVLQFFLYWALMFWYTERLSPYFHIDMDDRDFIKSDPRIECLTFKLKRKSEPKEYRIEICFTPLEPEAAESAIAS